jgi:predicted DNA-binding transcriptional regulator AlpA
MNRLLNNEEAAEILNISANTLNVLRSKGQGPRYIKVSGSIRYYENDIEEYIRNNSIDPATRETRSNENS